MLRETERGYDPVDDSEFLISGYELAVVIFNVLPRDMRRGPDGYVVSDWNELTYGQQEQFLEMAREQIRYHNFPYGIEDDS